MTQLSRRISPIMLFMLSMNAIIGSGWLFAPYYAARIAGPASIISWMIGGIAAILIALTFAELSAMLPVAGGTAHIPQLSHGPFVSYVLGWIAWVSSITMAPIEVQAVLQYASLSFPSLMKLSAGIPVLSAVGYVWAAILMLMLCVINIFSYRGLMRSNAIIFVVKFSIIFITIAAIMRAQFYPANFSGWGVTALSTSGWHSIFSAVATGGIVLAFNGFKSGVEMAGETKNLALAIPLSTAGAVCACLLIYIGLQAAFIGSLDPAVFKNGWSAISFQGDVGPFVGLAAALGLVLICKLLYTNAVVSPLGAGLIYVTSTARILYAMSKMGFVPAFLSRLNRQHLPMWAIVVNFIFGMLSFLPLPGWQAMVNFLVAAMVITYAMGPIALMSLRYTLPAQHRPFRLPAARIICLLAFYACNLFSYWTGWHTISRLGLVLLSGIIIFAIACVRKKVNLTRAELLAGSWMPPYLAGLVSISYLGSFGGRNVLLFGWDFAVIALFTVVIFAWAVKGRLPIQDGETLADLMPEHGQLLAAEG